MIIATGSIPRVFSLGDDEKVFTAADVLMDKKDCKSNTVIIGGGLVGCETALYLAKKGKKVTIIEALHKLLAVNGPLCSANKEMLEKLIKELEFEFSDIYLLGDARKVSNIMYAI